MQEKGEHLSYKMIGEEVKGGKKMKYLKIEAKILDKDKMATLITREGFDDSVSSTLEIIGILENIKKQELDKLNSIKRIQKNG